MSLFRRFTLIATVAACGGLLFAGEIFGPRISFPRVQPAPVNLGLMRRLTVADVKGEPARGVFSARFAEIAERDEIMKVAQLQSQADGLVHVQINDCSTVARQSDRHREGEGSEVWYATRCTARVRISDSRTGGVVSEYDVSAHASSRHESVLSIDMKNEAEREAVEQLAEFAAAKITPRKLIESIRLDNSAPAFEAGYALIRDGRFAEARQLWGETLKKNPKSAALRLDLGAVCEALGDNAAARRLYEEAIAIDSLNDRYGKALGDLDQRLRDASLLQQRPAILK